MNNLDVAFRSLFEINMDIKQGERILVFGDAIREDEVMSDSDRDRRLRLNLTARAVAEFADSVWGKASFVEFPATVASGSEPPELLWHATFGERAVTDMADNGILEKLLTKTADDNDISRAMDILRNNKENAADVIVAMSNNSASHTRYRALANSIGARFASLPHFDPDMFHTSMAVDWKALAERTKRLVDMINQATWLRVTTPNGTDMMICKKGRCAEGDYGLLSMPGAFGNLPAGEAYLAPLEGKSQGVMVVEWGPTRKLDEALRMTVEHGNVIAIEGNDRHRLVLESRFAENTNCRNIAELGIGTNDKASRPDNVLEAEKIMGTIHIALGDNTGFGGTVSAPFHEDYVFYQPTVTAILADGEEKTIIDAGRLLV